MYPDNVLIEARFPPCNTKEKFLNKFKTVFSRIQEKLGDKYKLVAKAAHNYDKEELKDPKALEKLESLTDAQVDLIPVEGDGKAEFLGSGTEKEYQDQVKEDKGLKGL